MKHVVRHDLDRATARKAADKAYESYSQRFAEYTPTATWTSETHCDVTFTVKGITLRGTIDLEPTAIAMDLDVPLLFRPFKKIALEAVEGQIEEWVTKARNGELD